MRYVLFALLLVVVGCSSNTSTQSDTSLTCSVSSASILNSSNQVGLTVTATGGEASYYVSSVNVNGYAGSLISGSSSFSSSSALTMSFASLTYATLQAGATGTVSIYDSADSAASTSCSFYVGTATTSSSSLACTMTPSSTTPYLNSATTFTVVGSGGTSPYTFSNFVPGTYGSVTSALAAVSSLQATAAASYSYAGSVTPSVQITDSLGNVSTCSTALTVQSTSSGTGTSGYLSCTVSLNPTSVARGQYVNAAAVITGYGAGNVYATQINYDSNSGMSGYFTGSTTAVLTFGYAGNWPVTFQIRDGSGNTSYCTGYQQVY